MRVLLAEDEVTIAVTLRDALEAAGHAVLPASDTAQAVAILERDAPEAVLTDIRMPGEGGMAVLRRSLDLDPSRPVVVLTGYATVDQAVEAMALGARNYVQKPFRNESLVRMVDTFARVQSLEAENARLRADLEPSVGFEGVVGASPAMRAVFDRVRTVAASDATVLIQGESGTGKERIARAIHRSSPRAKGPFVAISCGALPETLLEAELFGHEKGAFTDAHKERKGRFELADGGTLFLDDIDDMPLTVQVKLLRVLQERNFERVGGEATRAVDIRVVAATKVSLRERVKENRFREDLFYRIHVVPVVLPPLREREGDVALLVAHLVERHGSGRKFSIPRSTMAMLERYPWPGNVRELENAIQRAIALAGEKTELAAEDLLPLDLRWRGAAEPPERVRGLREVLREHEVEYIGKILKLTGGHRSQTAELLGISRKVLWEKIRDFGIEVPGGSGPAPEEPERAVGTSRELLELPETALEPGTRIVADLHLDLASEEGPRAFQGWLEALRGAPRLIVLGDLFDVWVGPAQERMPSGAGVIGALRALVARGTRLDVVHGNRDFLLDRRFEASTGARVHAHGLVGVLPGPSGRRALLIHGDELCTRDLGYQRLKRVVRSRAVTALAPRLPLSVGARLAKALRRSSVRALSVKLPDEKAMQESACRELAAAHRAAVVVCGHAHAFRDVELPGGPRWIVLDAFGGERDVLAVGADGTLAPAHSALP